MMDNNIMETRRTRWLRNKPSLESSPAGSRRVSQTPGRLPLNVFQVVLGNHSITALYRSQYREELVSGEPVDRLYVCDKCFKYTKEVVLHMAHMRFCEHGDSPPGRIVYEEEKYAVYEVDGEEHQLFTQNLSLFAKLFIENKSVCFDNPTFLYYLLVQKPIRTKSTQPLTSPPSKAKTKASSIMPKTSPPKPKSQHKRGVNTTEEGDSCIQPGQIIGYFSKEKLSWDNNNLACILVFPPWQRLGLGQFLIKVSYELARLEGRLGGPERPLSEPGEHSYQAYWSRTLAQTLLAIPSFGKSKSPKKVSVMELSEETWIAVDDVRATLKRMGVLGDARNRDGAVKMDKVLLRKWCAERDVHCEMEHLNGLLFQYDDEGSEDEELSEET